MKIFSSGVNIERLRGKMGGWDVAAYRWLHLSLIHVQIIDIGNDEDKDKGMNVNIYMLSGRYLNSQ